MREKFNKRGLRIQGGLRILGIIVAVIATIALLLHVSMASQASDGPLRWESSGQVTALDDNNQVTLTFTLVGGDNVIGEVAGAAFTLVAPVGGWAVVSSTGFDMPPSGPALYVGDPLGYVAMGNVLEPPIEVPHVVTLTLQFADGSVLEDGVLFDVVGRFDHGGPPLTQNPGAPDSGITIFPEPTEDASFDLISFTYAWAEKITAIVIDLGEGNTIATSALDLDTFNVHALHNRPTGTAWFFMNAYRTISDIYASNVNDWGTPADSGRFIVIEFRVWGPYGGLATGDGGGRMRFQYTVTPNVNTPLLTGGLSLLDFNFNQSNLNEDGFGWTRNVIIDQFETTFAREIDGLPGALTYNTFFSRGDDGQPLMNRPLFIHFHGGGQGTDWRQPLGYGNNATLLAEPYWQERYQAHILVPINGTTVNAQAILAEVVREMAATGYVDINRVSISGYSAGGTATINFMIRHPELVAAAVPICPATNPNTISDANLAIIRDIPQWWLNSEGEYSNAGHASIWTNVERFFGRAGGTLTARACMVNPVGRPPIYEPLTVYGRAHMLRDVRYTRFWDNNVKAWPYGPDVWLDYTHLSGVTDDGFWIFNGHQVWIPAFNGGVNVMYEYTMGWEPREPYDGFTPGDSTALFDWMFAQCRTEQEETYIWRLADPNNIQEGREYIVVSEYGALTNVGMVFYRPDEGRADPLGMTITPVTTVGDWITSPVSADMIWQFGPGNNVAAAAGGLGEGAGFHLLNDAPGTDAGRFPLRRDGSLNFATAPIMTTSMAVPNNQSLLLHVLDEDERTVSLYYWGGSGAWNFALEGTPEGFTARGASSNAAQLMPFLENAPLRLYERVTGVTQHSIVATAGANGEISPTSLSGHVWVTAGADKTFTFTPAFGFLVDTVLVNGEPVAVTENTFTFEDVTESEQTIHVTFKSDPAAVEIPFIVFNDIFPASGIVPFVYTTAVIIDLGPGNSANLADIDKDMFTVAARNTRLNGTTLVFEGERTITRAYVNTEPVPLGYIAPAPGSPDLVTATPASGRYIILELDFWGPTGPILAARADDGPNSTILNYRINMDRNLTYQVGGTSQTVLARFEQDSVVAPALDRFVPDRTNPDGPGDMRILIAIHEAYQEEGPLPLFIYNHGGGRGGPAGEADRFAPVMTLSGAAVLSKLQMEHPGRFDAHLIATQGHTNNQANRDALMAYVDGLVEAGKVDPNRIYMSGFSAGSGTTFGFLVNNPEFLAAIIPIGGGTMPTQAQINNNPGILDVAIWGQMHRRDGGGTAWYNYFNTGIGSTGVFREINVSIFDTHTIPVFPFFGWSEGNTHETEGAAFAQVMGTKDLYFALGAHEEYADLYVFDWLFNQCRSDIVTYEWRLADPNTIQEGREYIVVSEYGALTNEGMVFSKPDEGRADPLGMTITPVTTEGEWITSEVTPNMIWQFGPGNNVAAAADGLGEGAGFHLLNDAPGVNAGRFPLRRDGSLNFPTAPLMTTSMAVPNNQSLLLHVLDEDESTVSLYFWGGSGAWNFALEGTELGFTARGASSNAAQLMPFLQNAPLRLYERVRVGQHSIIATAGANGSIYPTSLAGHVWVDTGANQTFTFTPAFGFVVDTVLVDGEPVSVTDNTFTFANVTANHTIHVTFAADAAAVEIPFIVHNDIFPASGIVPFVYTTAVIIDLGEGNSANLADIDKDMFTVAARNTRLDGTTMVFEGERTITRAYVNTEPVLLGYIAPYPGSPDLVTATPASGRFIILELEFWGPTGPILAARADDGPNSTILNYRINMDRNLTYQVGGVSQTVLARFEQDRVVAPALDRFVPDRTNPGGPGDMRILIAIHEAYQEEGPLPLFIYNHGGGRGGPAGEADRFAPVMTLSGAAVLSKLQMEHPGRFDAHLIATQGHTNNQETRDALIAYVEGLVEAGKVDPNRIYMSGFSAGSGTTFGFLVNNPEFLAAIIPIGGGTMPTQAQIDNNRGILDVAIWGQMHRRDGGGTAWYNYFNTGIGSTGVFREINVSIFDTHTIPVFPFFGWSEGNTHETEGAAFAQVMGTKDLYFALGAHDEYADLYIFDWLFNQCRSHIQRNTVTFHLYTDNQRILDTFDDYVTGEVDGRAVIVVPVVPGTAPNLGDVLNLGNIYGTAAAPGYAFWGWFDGESLDASARVRAGLRRPALALGGVDVCPLVDLLAGIEDETAVFVDGNINLYGVWVRWGDLDDNNLVNMADLMLLQRYTNFSHVMDVLFSGAAADVQVDGLINMFDLNLHQRHINFGHLITVVLGEEPVPLP